MDGRVFGLGSNDAKAAVAAMTAAFLAFSETELPVTLALALVERKETSGAGTEAVLVELARRGLPLAAAIMGEPTGLDVAVFQKGLRVLELVAHGDACHAVWGERTETASAAPEPRRTAVLNGSMASVDARGTMTLRMGTASTSALQAPADRLLAHQTSEAAPIIAAMFAARPEARLFGFATPSNLLFMDGTPAVKCGPGSSERSHRPDEYVAEAEVLEGARFYARLVRTWAEGVRGEAA